MGDSLEKFHYYHFPILPPSAVHEHFTRFDESFCAAIYKEWVDEYQHKASLFYHVQLKKHRYGLWREFCREYSLDPEYPDGDYEYGWNDYRSQHGLTAHEESEQIARRQLESLDKRLFPDRSLIVTAADLAARFTERLMADNHPSF